MLPIDSFIPDILDKLSREKNLVITAAPGAGKTTRFPPALMKASQGKVVVLEPRRMAAIAAAHRIAEENNWTVGSEVGYQVRFANKVSTKTRLVFMTEALLARQMLQDPELKDIEAVVLDEFHERSLHVDLALGLLRELQELGRDIKIIIMSATLEADKVSSYLGNCPVVDVPGKLFPLEIRYQKNTQLLQTSLTFYENLTATIKEAQIKTANDILVFLPGVGEIERSRGYLEAWAESKKIDLVPLHGSLALEDQRKALQKMERQRIILATNIAESSVTLDGVDTVIDTGLAKNMKQDLRTGFSRLELGRISLSSAIQRSGRAARQYPGVSYRLWNKMDEISFSKSEIAEIQRVDLSESLLFLAFHGISDFHSFMWYEKPQLLAINKAVAYLQMAEAIDKKNQITTLGKKILQFPLPVRLAKLMIIGQSLKSQKLSAEIAALLQERDFFKKESSLQFIGDKLECDISARLDILHQFKQTNRSPRDIGYMALQTVSQSAAQILETSQRIINSHDSAPQQNNIKELLLKAFSDRLCRRRGKTERALMVGGRGVKLSAESLVRESEFFVALNGIEGSSDSETVVSLACGFDKDFVLETFKDHIQRVQDVVFIEDKGQFFRREYKAYLDLAIDEPSLIPASADEIAEKLPQVLSDRMDYVTKNNPALAEWLERLNFLEIHKDKAPESLQKILEDSLGGDNKTKMFLEAFSQACMGERRLHDVLAKDLVVFIQNVFPEEVVTALNKEVPDRVKMPSGSMIKVRYPTDKAPYLEVRIQEVFGWQKTPQVLWNKLPITLHLLGPNYRPVQVTSNLESFWKNGYPEVRKELRIKYPKHQWPEDPADGVAEAKGRRRT